FEAAVPRSLYLHQALGSDRNLDQVEGGCAAGGDELPIHAHLSVLRLHHDAKYARSYQRRETRPDLGGPVDALDAHCLREWLVAVRLNGQQPVARLCLVQQASALRNGERLSSESYRGMLFSELGGKGERQKAGIRLLRRPKSNGGDCQHAGGRRETQA